VNFVRLIKDGKILSPTVEVSFTGVNAKKNSGIRQEEQNRTFNIQPKKKASAIREGC